MLHAHHIQCCIISLFLVLYRIPILIANAVSSVESLLIYPTGIPAAVLTQLPVTKLDAFAMTGMCSLFGPEMFLRQLYRSACIWITGTSWCPSKYKWKCCWTKDKIFSMDWYCRSSRSVDLVICNKKLTHNRKMLFTCFCLLVSSSSSNDIKLSTPQARQLAPHKRVHRSVICMHRKMVMTL